MNINCEIILPNFMSVKNFKSIIISQLLKINYT